VISRKSQSDYYVSGNPVADATFYDRAGLVLIRVPDGLGGAWQAIASDLSGNRRRNIFSFDVIEAGCRP